MKPPAWKQFLSYFVDFQLESGQSDISPGLSLCLRKGRCYLSTHNAVYSYGDLYDNFTKTFRMLDFSKMSVQNVLILGFGMGSIPYMLEHIFKKNFRYTGVEADKLVVEWAGKYVLPELKSPVELVQADALAFAQTCAEKFDLVVMDVFVDDDVPEEFETKEFLEDLKNLLSESGLLLYNRLSQEAKDLKRTAEFYEKDFRKVFPEAGRLDLEGNWMLMNDKIFLQ